MRRKAVVGLLSGMLLGFLGSAWAEERPAHMEMTMDTRDKATFAGGCFWCMEHPFDDVDGVTATTVGYAGGPEVNPTYQQVASGQTGHAEAIEVVYDPGTVTYAQLLEVFWRNIDPTTLNKQFADVGTQYRTAIYYHTEEQRRAALESKAQLGRSGKFKHPIVTEITPASAFYPAEEYHQEYYKKHPIRYRLYRVGSGRDGFLKRVWGSSPGPAQKP